MLMSSGPHQTNIGKRECRQMPTAIRKLCGQLSTGPSAVLAQSKSRTRSAIPPPAALTSGKIIRAYGLCVEVKFRTPALVGATQTRILDARRSVKRRAAFLDGQDRTAARIVNYWCR